MKTRKTIAWTLLLLLCAPLAAQAAPQAAAAWNEGRLTVSWRLDGRTAAPATLTVYRSGWPVLVTCLRGREGLYRVPAACTNAAGNYMVRLRCGAGCVTVPVAAGNADTAPTNTPQVRPTASPAAATAAPQVRPAAAPVPLPTAVSAPAAGSTALAAEMIVLVNADRAANGLGAVSADAELTRAACIRAGEIVRSFSHTRPDGSAWSTVYSHAYAENIARGYATAEKAEAAFMTSQGHRENILRAGYTKIGVCALTSGGITYWVQLFGK